MDSKNVSLVRHVLFDILPGLRRRTSRIYLEINLKLKEDCMRYVCDLGITYAHAIVQTVTEYDV